MKRNKQFVYEQLLFDTQASLAGNDICYIFCVKQIDTLKKHLQKQKNKTKNFNKTHGK